MSGCGGLTDSCSKYVMCLGGGASFVKDRAHDKTKFLGGGGDTACGAYII